MLMAKGCRAGHTSFDHASVDHPILSLVAFAETLGLCAKVEAKAEGSENFHFPTATMVIAEKTGGRPITPVLPQPQFRELTGASTGWGSPATGTQGKAYSPEHASSLARHRKLRSHFLPKQLLRPPIHTRPLQAQSS